MKKKKNNGQRRERKVNLFVRGKESFTFKLIWRKKEKKEGAFE